MRHQVPSVVGTTPAGRPGIRHRLSVVQHRHSRRQNLQTSHRGSRWLHLKGPSPRIIPCMRNLFGLRFFKSQEESPRRILMKSASSVKVRALLLPRRGSTPSPNPGARDPSARQSVRPSRLPSHRNCTNRRWKVIRHISNPAASPSSLSFC